MNTSATWSILHRVQDVGTSGPFSQSFPDPVGSRLVACRTCAYCDSNNRAGLPPALAAVRPGGLSWSRERVVARPAGLSEDRHAHGVLGIGVCVSVFRRLALRPPRVHIAWARRHLVLFMLRLCGDGRRPYWHGRRAALVRGAGSLWLVYDQRAAAGRA